MADNFFKVNKGLSLEAQANPPTNPQQGDVYNDGTDLLTYGGTNWVKLGEGGAGPGGASGYRLNLLIDESFEEGEFGDSVNKWKLYDDQDTFVPSGIQQTDSFIPSPNNEKCAKFQLLEDYTFYSPVMMLDDYKFDGEIKLEFYYTLKKSTGFAADLDVEATLSYLDIVNNREVKDVIKLEETAGGKLVSLRMKVDRAPDFDRLVFSITNKGTGASADVQVDEFYAGPKVDKNVYGLVGTDPKKYTPQTQGFGTISDVHCSWSKSGKFLYLDVYFKTGTTAAVTATVSMPEGLVADLIGGDDPDVNENYRMVGKASVTNNSTLGFANHPGVYARHGKNELYFHAPSSGDQPPTALMPGSSQASNYPFHFQARIPIKGWGSNTLLSHETDNRMVVFRGTKASDQSITAGTDITLSADEDNYNAWDGSGFVAPKDDLYTLSGVFSIAFSGSNPTIYLYVDGIFRRYLLTATWSGGINPLALKLPLLKGERLSLRSSKGITVNGLETQIEITSSPTGQTISATEAISASYYCSVNKSVSTTVPIDFDYKEWDTHNAVTTGASWKFKVPANGEYEVSGTAIYLEAGCSYYLYKNGTKIGFMGHHLTSSAATLLLRTIAKKGDELEVRPSLSGTISGEAGGLGVTRIQIRRVGIYTPKN